MTKKTYILCSFLCLIKMKLPVVYVTRLHTSVIPTVNLPLHRKEDTTDYNIVLDS